MLGLTCVVIFVSILQGVYLQGPAEALCGPPPVDKPFECCKTPHLFSEEDRADCGVVNPSEGQRRGPDCSKTRCLMKKKNLMKDDQDLDLEAVAAFLDKWTEENSDFKDAVSKAKAACLKDNVSGPPGMCGPDKVAGCMFFEIFNNCPTWEQSEKCDKVKKHMDECRAKLLG